MCPQALASHHTALHRNLASQEPGLGGTGGREGFPITWKAGEDRQVPVAVCTHQRRVSVLLEKDRLRTGIESLNAEVRNSQDTTCDRLKHL